MNYSSEKRGWLTVTTINLPLPRLDPQFNGFKLVQLSDIHIGTWIDRPRLEFTVDTVNALEPDVVAITGDFVTRRPEAYAPDLIASLSRIRAVHGSLAVRGNHDHWSDPVSVERIIRASGMIHLRNGVYSIERASAGLHFAGVDCHYEGQARLDQVLSRIPAAGAAILLVHEPDFADISARSKRFDLQISGHTHGGQVILPWIGPPILPRYGRRYPLGLYRVNGMLQYTNRGVGTSHIKLRFNCPPEITLFKLFAGTSHGPDERSNNRVPVVAH